MEVISMHRAKSMLSKLVKQAADGTIFFIGAYGKAEARLGPAIPIPMQAATKKHIKRIGLLKGKLKVPDNFDDPLPEEILRTFEGD